MRRKKDAKLRKASEGLRGIVQRNVFKRLRASRYPHLDIETTREAALRVEGKWVLFYDNNRRLRKGQLKAAASGAGWLDREEQYVEVVTPKGRTLQIQAQDILGRLKEEYVPTGLREAAEALRALAKEENDE